MFYALFWLVKEIAEFELNTDDIGCSCEWCRAMRKYVESE